ncbi:MAG: SLC13 family permease [Pirellulaceae bacterium]|nr:SLC13 family permease [Pirellulaceae bacterium]
MDLAWLSLAALLVVVAISCTARVNPGLVAIVFAWLIVLFGGTLPNHPLKDELTQKGLIANFSSDLFLQLVGISLLFTLAESNGTLARVAAICQGLCRGNRGLVPLMFFALAFGLGSLGPGNIAIAGLVAPVAMTAAVKMGISPLLMALAVGHGAIASTVSPFTAAGVVVSDNLAKIGLPGHEWRIFAANALANLAIGCGGYLLLGGWKLFRPTPAAETAEPTNQPATTLEARHWLTISVVAMVLLAIAMCKANLGLAAFAGATLLLVLRQADEREAILKMPWGVIVMVCGVSLLATLLDKTKGTEKFAGLIASISTPGTRSGVLALVTGLVSIYSSTTAVVIPAFLPMVSKLADLTPGSDKLSLAQAVLVGGNLVDMSPFSTIGALCLAGTPPETDRRLLFNQLLAWGFVVAFLGAILCWICF